MVSARRLVMVVEIDAAYVPPRLGGIGGRQHEGLGDPVHRCPKPPDRPVRLLRRKVIIMRSHVDVARVAGIQLLPGAKSLC